MTPLLNTQTIPLTPQFVQDESLKNINERGDIHIHTKIYSIGLKISFSVDSYVDILLQKF